MHDPDKTQAQLEAELAVLILMDAKMTVMDGPEATRRIRADAELKHIPVIALTGLAMEGDEARCLAAGANDYLTKPVNLKKLLGAIEAQLVTWLSIAKLPPGR